MKIQNTVVDDMITYKLMRDDLRYSSLIRIG